MLSCRIIYLLSLLQYFQEHSPPVDYHPPPKVGRKRRGTSPYRQNQPVPEEITGLTSPASANLAETDTLQSGGAATASSTVLPPRKRYKGVSDGPGSDNGLPGDIGENEEVVAKDPIVSSSSSQPLDEEERQEVGPAKDKTEKERSSDEPEIPKKRPRGV